MYGFVLHGESDVALTTDDGCCSAYDGQSLSVHLIAVPPKKISSSECHSMSCTLTSLSSITVIESGGIAPTVVASGTSSGIR